MLRTISGDYAFAVTLADEQATHRLMVDVAALIEPGDLITLSGDLGAGKTTFARALIRHLANDETIEVPSPSFTLMQTYELPGYSIMHGDLYRLSTPSELAELGFDDMPERALVLLEWPDRAAGLLPANRLDIALTLSPEHGLSFRHARITGYGTMAARAERIAVLRQFLDASGFGDAKRRRIQGDASTRSYERLTRGMETFILMNAPRRPDGLPIRDGKPYSAIAHLAEDVTPFIAMARALCDCGLSAPAVFHADRDAGILLLEDLGSEPVVKGDPPAPVEERYEMAVDVLAKLHSGTLPESLPVADGFDYRLPRYDMDALLIEVELLADWYLPLLGGNVTPAARAGYLALWHNALRPTLDQVQNGAGTWVLRDFHSPNLIWLPERSGVARVGLLDFQDALIGHPAYDLASLLQDARVDVPEMMEIALLSRYTRTRLAADENFDVPDFVRIYSTLAAQRASKILGIFARLDRRDGKPQYLRHLPRIRGYLQRALAHPVLASLNAWYTANVPALQADK
ncbi:MAG TPA: tRNA (adenosine(37)-N6)-threonylcarbamoyltransferase complex ATPase subunit type 1 TsaE [Pseudolabrys sp.]|nr:tRNA (adenosine(37)-N6)-threonylcarbamoyltransferase complex ATPase subunit type 1 TsaE [Pseudolabrys sp.]